MFLPHHFRQQPVFESALRIFQIFPRISNVRNHSTFLRHIRRSVLETQFGLKRVERGFQFSLLSDTRRFGLGSIRSELVEFSTNSRQGVVCHTVFQPRRSLMDPTQELNTPTTFINFFTVFFRRNRTKTMISFILQRRVSNRMQCGRQSEPHISPQSIFPVKDFKKTYFWDWQLLSSSFRGRSNTRKVEKT